MPGTGYIIRTAKGDRGPYNAEQIRAFAAAGKLPFTARIRNTASDRTVSVQQVVDGSSAFASVAAGTEELDTGYMMTSAPAPVLARPTQAGTASHRRTTRSLRRADTTAGSGSGRASRKPSPAGEQASARGTGRVARRPPPARSKVKLIVGITLALTLVAGAVAFSISRNRAPESVPTAPTEPVKTGTDL